MPTNLINIDSVEVAPNRQRRQFNASELRELSDSIENQSIGLMHPIIVRQLEGKYILVAGERRLRAIKDSHELGVTVWHAGKAVPPGQIPYISLGQMEPLAAWEAELEENVRRTDLTWQEKAEATSQLFALRDAQAANASLPRPTTASLAEELVGKPDVPVQQETIRQELILARQLHDPDVAAAKSRNDAMKVVKRKEVERLNRKIAETVGKTFSSDSHAAFNDDSAAWVKLQPANTFDVILTDPPYGMGADKFGEMGGGAHGYEDSAEHFFNIMKWLPAETFRVAKPQAHIYLFCDFDWFPQIKTWMEAVGWKVFRTPLIWSKPNGYSAPWPDQGPQRAYEMVLFAVKGDKTTKKMARDVLTYNPDENLGHAAQKPVALFADLLSRSAIAGDSVLDPFGGTGPLLEAAHQLKCRATVIEKDPASYGIALTRLKGLK